MTVYLPLECPSCKDTKSVVKFGKSSNSKQRYCCQNDKCDRKTFIVRYDNKGWLAEIREKILDMAMNGAGIRDTSRVLCVSQKTVMSTLKKRLCAHPN
ncbi:MAG: IS1 family transposase [Myxococcales bacterium]|nr:MAG: IS1 family transposase [Myxococcales bacterium]